MQLIGMLDSPYVRRVAVALLFAGVPFEHRPISLFRHIDRFKAITPLLKAPTLVLDDGTTLVESSVILDYLAALYPAVEAMSVARAANPAAAARACGVALTVCEKAVQAQYERSVRTPEQRSEVWMSRVGGQLRAGLETLDAEVPESGWISGEKPGAADIAVVCAWGFAQSAIGDLVDLFDVRGYGRLADFRQRAERLRAFQAAPAIDGVTAPIG